MSNLVGIGLSIGQVILGAVQGFIEGKIAKKDLKRIESKLDLNSNKLDEIVNAVKPQLGPHPSTEEVIRKTVKYFYDMPIDTAFFGDAGTIVHPYGDSKDLL